MDENYKKMILRFITNRMLILSVVLCVMFYMLVVKLFDLQIIKGETVVTDQGRTYTETLISNAPRGTIYDRLGRPLAINKPAYTIKLNPGVQVENLNEVVLNLAQFLDKQGEKYTTQFPISATKPYTFLFNDSAQRELRWKKDLNILEEEVKEEKAPAVTAEKAIAFLRTKFNVAETTSDEDAWNIVAFRSLIYINRYKLHEPITIAFDVKEETVVMLSEHSDRFESFYVDVEPLREYPGKEYVSHMVGYIRKDTESVKLEGEKIPRDVTVHVGETGLERAFEANLKGERGVELVQMDKSGRPQGSTLVTPFVQGDKLFTTIDLGFQKQVYHILEDQLEETLTNKMLGKFNKDTPVTTKGLLMSMVKSNNISSEAIMASGSDADSFTVKTYVLETLDTLEAVALEAVALEADALEADALNNGQTATTFKRPDVKTPEGRKEINNIIADAIESGKITQTKMLLIMHEQDIIKGDEAYVENIRNGRFGILQVLLAQIEEGEITPQMTNLDPSTGTVVVVEIASGDVISAVSYPTFDNNQFVNYFNNDYWHKVNNDPTYPTYNRAFMEPRAPGSTFKMVTAIAGLESGIITPTTRIYDEYAFTKAGKPPARCWSRSSHGHINVVDALAGSCNYFFSEMAYRMGNVKDGNPYGGIRKMDEYMLEFGFNDRSGVEIGEYRDSLTHKVTNEQGEEVTEPLPLVISSPEYKSFIEKSRNPEATVRDYGWYDIDTVQTSFGQSKNNYTAAVMAKYIATIASRGVRRDLHLMSRIETSEGLLTQTYSPINETKINVSDASFDQTWLGMRKVITSGTARNVFSGFPIEVGGKTGTAQENLRRDDHSSFGGFAPYDNPQIAVYVLIPYGETKPTAAPASQVARDVIAAYFGLDNAPELAPKSHELSM